MTSILDDAQFVANLLNRVGAYKWQYGRYPNGLPYIHFHDKATVALTINPDGDLTVNGKPCLAVELVGEIRRAIGK